MDCLVGDIAGIEADQSTGTKPNQSCWAWALNFCRFYETKVYHRKVFNQLSWVKSKENMASFPAPIYVQHKLLDLSSTVVFRNTISSSVKKAIGFETEILQPLL